MHGSAGTHATSLTFKLGENMSFSRVITIITVLLFAGYLNIALGQARGRRHVTQKPTMSQTDHPGETNQKEDKYWTAQREIETAIQELEAYLNEFPDGDRAATARQQLQVLRGLSLTASRPEWVKMDSLPLSYVPRWRVSSIDPQPDKARLTVEIDCRREDGGDCYFDPFDRSPLVLIDDAGRFYPMLEAGPLPSDIRFKDDRQATLSGGRTISVTVDFAPLSGRAVSGQIYYRDNNRATPARFSLSRQK
jgi:hypothetical protein